MEQTSLMDLISPKKRKTYGWFPNWISKGPISIKRYPYKKVMGSGMARFFNYRSENYATQKI